jgi:hypothetical protein
MDEIIKADGLKEQPNCGAPVLGKKKYTTVEAKHAAQRILEWAQAIDNRGEMLMHKDYLALTPTDRMRVNMDCIKVLTPRNVTLDVVNKEVTIEAKLIQLSSTSI